MKYMYILKNREPVHVSNCTSTEFETFFNSKERIIARTDIGDVIISTVFLCIDHNFININDPILFETMVFHGKYDGYQKRYRTYDEAYSGHAVVAKMVRNNL